jgi:hypothetical protein
MAVIDQPALQARSPCGAKHSRFVVQIQRTIGLKSASPHPQLLLGCAAMTPREETARPSPVWSIAANVLRSRPYGPGGAELRRGLKLFAGGAKVYVAGGFAGMGYETVTVVGRPRGSRRYSIVHVRAGHLTNWRVELVYSPAAMRRIHEVREDSQGGFGLAELDPAASAYRDALVKVAEGLRASIGDDRERPPTGSSRPPTGGRPRSSHVLQAFRRRAARRVLGIWQRILAGRP